MHFVGELLTGASERETLLLRIGCACAGGSACKPSPPHSAHDLRYQRREYPVHVDADGAWGYTDANGACTLFDARVGDRIVAICASGSSEEHYFQCYSEGKAPDGHQETFNRNKSSFAVLNRTCALERHRAIYGDRFVPVNYDPDAWSIGADDQPSGSVPLPPPPPPGISFAELTAVHAESRPVPEVFGCLEAPEFVRRHALQHAPLVLRGCAFAASPRLVHWASDAYLVDVASNWLYAHARVTVPPTPRQPPAPMSL